MPRYSVSQWIFGQEPIEASVERLARFGYDGIELAGEPESTDVPRVLRRLERHGLVVSSVCGLYTAERDLSHVDESVRRGAVAYAKACVDLAAETGAEVLIVVPSPVAKPAPLAPAEVELELAARSIREVGEYAAEREVALAIEALNRFETYLVTKIGAALALASRVALPNVGVMVDTFHMNIEEPSPILSVQRAGAALRHVHLADSNREAVGRGHVDFGALVRVLRTVNYEGWYTMEFLPPLANPYVAASFAADAQLFDSYCRESIERMREIADAAS